jgi:hypothetical protein
MEGTMRRFLLASLAALALWPAATRAVVTVRPEVTNVVQSGADQIATIEVFATNPDDAENERLNAYTISLEAPTFRATGNAPRFIIPPADPASGVIAFAEPTAHPYVFGAFPGNGPVDPAGLSDFDTVLLSAALGGTGQEANLSNNLNGFARIQVLIPAGTPEGVYPINIPQPAEGGFLSLGSAGTSIVAIGAPGLIFTPEPCTLGLLAPLGLLALRRRHRCA